MRRVVNQLSVGSFGVDSLANGAPPPGYTSQRDTASSIAVINDNEEDGMLKNSPPPPPMESPHSQRHRDPLPTLSSPYSIEDLRVRSQLSHEQDQNPRLSLHQSSTCTHGYTPTHSQCTPVRSSSYYPPQQQQQRDARPLSSDALHFYSPPQILSTDNIFGATNEQSRQCSTEEHWQPPVKADNRHRHQQPTSPYTDYRLPTSPYHHHRQNTYPPPLRVLSYSSTDEGHYGCMEYGNEEEGNQSSLVNDQRMMMMMNSTATILSPSEEPLGYQSSHDLPRHRRRQLPSPPNGPTRQATIAIDPSKTATKKNLNAKSSTKAHSTPPPLPPTQTQPTNYVYISRKCNPSIPVSKSRGRRKSVEQPNVQIPPAPPKLSSSSSSSAITGTFTINPELHIPPSLLNAMEDPVFFRFDTSSDRGETRKRKGSKRKTNLRLEVENGGIDVDIHLVPTTTISNDVGEEANVTGNRGQQARDTSFCDTPLQVPASASASTTAFIGPPSSTTHSRQQSSIRMQENPSSGTSSRKGIITPAEVTQHTTSRRDIKKPSRPTTIDLRIKQAYYQQGSLNLQSQDSVKINGPIAFPLIARIRAPNPRPPFHLFASTIDIPTTNPIQTTDSTTPNPNQRLKEAQVLNTLKQTHRASTSNPTSIRNSQVFSEPTPIIVNPPPSPLPRRRTRRSLSKYHPQRVSVASSHGHGGTATGDPSQALPSLSQLNLASSSLYSSPPPPPPSSPLYLHLPRTFRGPLTIHISSGHIIDRLRLSEGLEREVALIRESEFSRGYFVGGLGQDNNMDVDNRKKRVQVQDEGREEEETGGNDVNLEASGSGRGQIERKKKKAQLGNKNINKNIVNSIDESELSSSSVSSSSSSSGSSPGSSSSPAAWKGVQGEWYGDRIEILVGSGDVFLQFEDENEDDGDPFCRTRGMKKEVGFWKKFFSYPSFIS